MKSFIESLDLDSLPVFRHGYEWRCEVEVEDEISREDKLVNAMREIVSKCQDAAGKKDFVFSKELMEICRTAQDVIDVVLK